MDIADITGYGEQRNLNPDEIVRQTGKGSRADSTTHKFMLALKLLMYQRSLYSFL